jgi:hypothetical protein
MEVETKPNGQKEKTRGESALEKITEILKEHNCQLICVEKMMYGQRIFVPVVDEIPEK